MFDHKPMGCRPLAPHSLPKEIMKVHKEIVREELETIRQAHDGVLTAEDVVTAATDPDHPLHPCFEWDDAVAGHQHRLTQAYTLIRPIEIQWRTEQRERHAVETVWTPILPQYTPQPSGELGYVPTIEVLREQPEDLLTAEWRRANGHIDRLRNYLMAAGFNEQADLIRATMDTVYAAIIKPPDTQATVAATNPASTGAASRRSARQGRRGEASPGAAG